MNLRLVPERIDAAPVAPLIDALAEEYRVRYGELDGLSRDPSQFAPPHGLFLLAVDDQGPAGCAGYRRQGDGAVELKRMYVVPRARGRGIARLLLSALEERAEAAGAVAMRLEAGRRQPEAMRLYESSGYVRIPLYDAEWQDELSVCYEKRLASSRAGSGGPSTRP